MGIGYNLGDTILHSFKGDDMKKLFYLPMIMMFILSACVSSATSTAIPDPLEMKENVSIEITSSAFTQGGSIPDQYTCKGKDISPPLAWGEPPAGTKSFALIMDDPDRPSAHGIIGFFSTFPSPREACLNPSAPTPRSLMEV